MSFPIFWIHGDEGEHIDGRLEHIEFSVSAEVMKTISGIAALHILPEGLSKTVGTAFVSVARNTLIVRPHKDTVVIFAVLKESLCFRKIAELPQRLLLGRGCLPEYWRSGRVFDRIVRKRIFHARLREYT